MTPIARTPVSNELPVRPDIQLRRLGGVWQIAMVTATVVFGASIFLFIAGSLNVMTALWNNVSQVFNFRYWLMFFLFRIGTGRILRVKWMQTPTVVLIIKCILL